MITKDELSRILDVAKDNAGLKKQLDNIRTTWAIIDSEYVSLVSERRELQDQLQKIEQNLYEVNDKLRSVKNAIAKIEYGDDCPQPGNIFQNQGMTSSQYSIKKESASNDVGVIGSATWPYPNGNSQ
jgi:chromosome segregation ATPase